MIAAGVGEYGALAKFAKAGFERTVRLAQAGREPARTKRQW